jgi:hypothetical protein
MLLVAVLLAFTDAGLLSRRLVVLVSAAVMPVLATALLRVGGGK